MIEYSLRAKLANFIRLQLLFVCLIFFPLAMFNLWAAKFFAVGLDLAAIVVAAIFFFVEKKISSIKALTIFIIYSYTFIAAVSISEDRASALYWFFPIALFCLLLLRPQMALINICLIFFLLPLVFVVQFGFSHELVLFFASGLVMIGFSYSFVLSGAEIEKIAITDELTGIYNRRILKNFEELVERWQSSTYDNFHFVVVVFDINKFKEINDRFGHQVGDECLVKFSSLLLGIVEKYKELSVARIGGDEFLVFGPIENLDYVVEEQIEYISKFNIICGNSEELSVTSSFGLAADGLRMIRDNGDLASLIHQADAEMYSRKYKLV